VNLPGVVFVIIGLLRLSNKFWCHGRENSAGLGRVSCWDVTEPQAGRMENEKMKMSTIWPSSGILGFWIHVDTVLYIVQVRHCTYANLVRFLFLEHYE
jgi:hypothetical protein